MKWFRLGLSFVVWQVLLTIHHWLPEHRFWLVLMPSMEVAIMMGLVSAVVIVRRPTDRLVWLMAAAAAPLTLFATGEALTRHIYGQPFVPTIDIPFVLPLLTMVLGRSESLPSFVVFVAVAVPLLLLAALFWALLRGVTSSLQELSRRALVVVALVATGGALAAAVTERPTLPLLLARQWHPERQTVTIPQDSKPSVQPSQGYAFPGIRDVDVLMFVVESYGQTLLTQPEHRALITGAMTEMNSELSAAGYSIASAILDSPTSGGRSWLADATLLTGVRVDSQHLYDTILLGDTPNLTHDLGTAGYRRVMAAPGTTETTEQWRAFYQFDDYYTQDRFGYRGPHFAFGAMPDQFTLNFIRKQVLAKPTDTPLFLQAMLVSSHVPFDSVPHYVDNWDLIGDGTEWSTAPNPKFRNNWLNGGEYPEGFTASIRYVLRVLSDFVLLYVPDDALVIVVGDHQPRYPIRERDATKGVLMHVLSRESSVVDAFLPHGFSNGVIPPPNQPLLGMESFYEVFLDVAGGRSRDDFTDVP